MLSRSEFTSRFGNRALIAMVHLRPLPGAPLFRSLDEVTEGALADARAIRDGGAAGMIFENFGDRPFQKRVDAETIASMAAVIAIVAHEVKLPFGVNVLRNDGLAALAVAAATGAAFIRINVLTGAMVTDQGIIEGRAADLLRKRETLAPLVAIFADHLVKHASPLGSFDPVQSVKDLRSRALADAIVVTGKATGAAADSDELRELRSILPDAPLIVGSGIDAKNASLFTEADAAIVGTSIKRDGDVELPVESARVARIVEAFC
ncbi:MAG TPA: BtpA/SgcQ family protein [Thermoanaerobaculia bacterium]